MAIAREGIITIIIITTIAINLMLGYKNGGHVPLQMLAICVQLTDILLILLHVTVTN